MPEEIRTTLPKKEAEQAIEELFDLLKGLSWQLVEDQCYDDVPKSQKAKQATAQINSVVAHFIGIPIGRRRLESCKLPCQPDHKFHFGLVCVKNSKHKFCRSHNLKKCPICGKDLKKI